ncbi:MAG: hypothetical protein L7H18_00860 [Candidatus Nealsonbacteria bacterium DGGOD1a]|jgi:hypothetical protein|nr:MAG: hypothetical protein L7H18_00860 [Candidatus Nealsonbacteria bacterium DGGOD1a]
MQNKINKFVYWAPRILSILFILFLAMFSLDVFEEGRSWQEIAIALFMHNVPVLALLAVLIISWKREIVGGVAFILAGILYIAMVAAGVLKNGFEWYMVSWFLTISGPAFLIGGLFLVAWHRKKDKTIKKS